MLTLGDGLPPVKACGKVRGMRILLAILLLLSSSAWAQSLPAGGGLAMHGQPKYAADFKNFDYVNPAAPKGGTLRLSAVGTFDNVNPYIIKGTPPRPEQFNVYVFESLMYRSADEPFTVYPWLAERAAMAPDRGSITFALNPKAAWPDGTPFTVDDVLFTVETLKTRGRPSHRAYYGKVASVQKLGARGVLFTFNRLPDGTYDRELPLIMALMPMLPKHYWEARMKAGKPFDETTLDPVMGSGAYQIAAVDVGRQITLKRNPSYWGRDLPVMRGQQNFDNIIIDYFRDDGVAREAFLAGAVDLRFEQDPLKMRQAYKGDALEGKTITLDSIPHQRPEPMRGLFINARRVLFGDAVLRRALALAGDFDQLNRTLYGGTFKRSLSSFPNSILASPNAVPPTLDRRARLQQAKDMLTRAGYTYKDGKLFTPFKQPVAFEVLLGDAGDERLVLSWREAIRPLGTDIAIRTVDTAQFQSRLNDFDYDMVVFRLINSLSPGNEQRIYWGSAAAGTPGSRNYAGVRDAAIDALTGKFLNVTTYDELVTTAHALDDKLIDGAYVIPFFYLGADLVAKSERISCPTKPPLTGFELRSCWYINK